MSVRAESVGSELVLGFVGPVGVANGRFHNAAMDRLRAFGYHPVLIRLSERLDDLKAEGLLTTELWSEPEFERVRSHMDAGDELRGLDMPGARGLLAAAAVAKIASERRRNPQGQTMPMPRYAWLISSLKNPAEVEVLRSVYGSGFFLVGLFDTEAERKRTLERGMTPDEAKKLILRDADSEAKHGQQTRKTFELADAWVRTIARKDDSGDVLAFDHGRATPRGHLATTTYLEEEFEAAAVLEDAKKALCPHVGCEELKREPRP